MTVNSCNKGKRFEREIAEAFRQVYPDAKRGFQFRGGGQEAPDVVLDRWHVECKVGARPNPLAALEQATRDATEGRVPIAVCKRDRKETTVTMRFEDFLRLCAKADGEVSDNQ